MVGAASTATNLRVEMNVRKEEGRKERKYGSRIPPPPFTIHNSQLKNDTNLKKIKIILRSTAPKINSLHPLHEYPSFLCWLPAHRLYYSGAQSPYRRNFVVSSRLGSNSMPKPRKKETEKKKEEREQMLWCWRWLCVVGGRMLGNRSGGNASRFRMSCVVGVFCARVCLSDGKTWW
jgi:hypothetical protein